MMPDFKLIFTVSTDPRSDLGVDGEPAPPTASPPCESEGGRLPTWPPAPAPPVVARMVKAACWERFDEVMDGPYATIIQRITDDVHAAYSAILQACDVTSPGRTDAPSPGEDPHDPPPCGGEPATPDALSPPSRGASGTPADYPPMNWHEGRFMARDLYRLYPTARMGRFVEWVFAVTDPEGTTTP